MIIKNSFKQLLRRPGKAILFFLLMAAATLLLVFGAGMYVQSLMRLAALGDTYSTIGTIQQPWESVRYEEDKNACMELPVKTVQDYGRVINPSELDFEGAGYLVKPENRPYYISYNPELNNNWNFYQLTQTKDVLEFEPLESSSDGSAVQAKVTRLVYEGTENLVNRDEETDDYIVPRRSKYATKVGDEITVCQHKEEWSVPLEKGKRYIACFGMMYGAEQEQEFEVDGEAFTGTFQPAEFSPIEAPYTSLVDELGEPLPTGLVPYYDENIPRIVETSDEVGMQAWLNMVEERSRRDQTLAVMPVTDPETVECFRTNNITVRGRMITDEEWREGARVCLIDSTIAKQNFLYEGKKLKLSMIASMYGYTPDRFGLYARRFVFPEVCSLMDGSGDLLTPFWEAEYEIAGIYTTHTTAKDLPFTPMVIIPSRSVQASDEGHIVYYGPMNEIQTSFRIPNGAQEEFGKALLEAVPDAERLNIVYDDMGYSRAAESLESTRDTAFLLLLVGLLAAVAIVVLLLYFFVVREKKRTAIERSLGETKAQCRLSILAALMTMTLIAAGLGSFGAAVLLDRSDQLAEAQNVMADSGAELSEVESTDGSGYVSHWGLGGVYNFSGQYSPWAMWDIKGSQTQVTEVTVPLAMYVGAPLALWGLVALLAVVLVNRNLKIEPILLLGTRA